MLYVANITEIRTRILKKWEELLQRQRKKN